MQDPSGLLTRGSSLKKYWYLLDMSRVIPIGMSHLQEEVCSPHIDVVGSGGHLFIDTLATSGVTWDQVSDQELHKDSVLPPHLMESTAEMLCFVPRSNRPSQVKDWTKHQIH